MIIESASSIRSVCLNSASSLIYLYPEDEINIGTSDSRTLLQDTDARLISQQVQSQLLNITRPKGRLGEPEVRYDLRHSLVKRDQRFVESNVHRSQVSVETLRWRGSGGWDVGLGSLGLTRYRRCCYN